jgi:hypothetical protein
MGGTTTPAQAAQTVTAAANGWDAAAQPDATPAASAPASTPPSTPPSPSPAAQQPSSALPAAPSNVSFPATNPPAEPPVVTSNKRPGILGVIDSVADALTGRTTPEMGRDQYGNEYVKQRVLGRGEQWARIGASLAQGAAAGFAAGRGRNAGAAAAAGLKVGEQQTQQRQQQQQQMTAEARQQNLDNANHQMLLMNLAEHSFNAARLQVQANEEDTKFAQAQVEHLVKDFGGTVLGTMQTPADLRNILKVNPDVMADMIQKHQIELVPQVQNGKQAGFAVVKMPDSFRTSVLPPGAEFLTFDATTGKFVKHNSTEPLTAGEQMDYNNVAYTQKLQYDTKAAEIAQKQAETNKANAETAEVPSTIAKNRAEVTHDYAAAAHENAETKQLNQAQSQDEVNQNAQQLVEGTLDPSNLSKRSKTYDATLAAANQYSMTKYGHPFDIAKAMGDYKFATNPSTYTLLNYLNSLTGRDNNSGNLGLLVQMSDKLPRTEFPPLNAVDQWAKLSAGNPQVAAYRAALVEVDDQIAKVLQGGGAGGGGTSDAKLRQAAEILNKNFTAQQIKSVATDTLRPLLANRKSEVIGTNRYLQQWHQPTTQQQPQQVFSPSAWAAANPGKDVNAAIAEAKRRGIPVMQ